MIRSSISFLPSPFLKSYLTALLRTQLLITKTLLSFHKRTSTLKEPIISRILLVEIKSMIEFACQLVSFLISRFLLWSHYAQIRTSNDDCHQYQRYLFKKAQKNKKDDRIRLFISVVFRAKKLAQLSDKIFLELKIFTDNFFFITRRFRRKKQFINLNMSEEKIKEKII